MTERALTRAEARRLYRIAAGLLPVVILLAGDSLVLAHRGHWLAAFGMAGAAILVAMAGGGLAHAAGTAPRKGGE